jgi:hypothetical protein
LHNRHLRENALHSFKYQDSCYFITLGGASLDRVELYEISSTSDTRARLRSVLEIGRSATGLTMAKDVYLENDTVVAAIAASTDLILVEIRWNQGRAQPMEVKSTIRLQHSIISSVCLNPYAGAPLGSLSPYDCAVASLDGAVWAWEGYNSSKLRLLKPPDDLQGNAEAVSVPLMCWGAHPRVILFAKGPNLYEIDYRTSASLTRSLWSSTEDGGAASESVLALTRLQNSPERFTYVFATDHHLILMDSRYSRRPLLKWRHRLRSVCHGIMRCLHIKDGQYFLFLSSTEQVSSPAAIYVWQFELDSSNSKSVDDVEADIAAIVDELVKEENISDDEEVDLEFKQPSRTFSFGPLCPRLASLPQKLPVFNLLTHSIRSLRWFDIQAFGLAVFVAESKSIRHHPKSDESGDVESESSSNDESNSKERSGDPQLHVLHCSAACDVFYQRFSISADLIPSEIAETATAPLLNELEKRNLDPPGVSDKSTRSFRTVDLSRVVKYMIKHRVLPDKDDAAPKRSASSLKDINPAWLVNALEGILKFLRYNKKKHDIKGELPPRTLSEITVHLTSLYPGYRMNAQMIETLINEFNNDPEVLLGPKADDFDEDDRIYSFRLSSSDSDAPNYVPAAEVLYSVSPLVGGIEGEEEDKDRAPDEEEVEADEGGGGFDRTIASVLASQTQGSFLSQGQQGILATLLKKFKQSTQGEAEDEDDSARGGDKRRGLLARLKSSWDTNRPENAPEEGQEQRQQPDESGPAPTTWTPGAAQRKAAASSASAAPTPKARNTKQSPTKTPSASTRKEATRSDSTSDLVAPSAVAPRPTVRKVAPSRSSVLSPPSSQMAPENDDDLAPLTQNTQPPVPMFSSPAASWLNRSGGFSSMAGFGTPGDQVMGFGTQSFGSPPASQMQPATQNQSQFGGFGMFGSPQGFGVGASQPFGTPSPWGSQNPK